MSGAATNVGRKAKSPASGSLDSGVEHRGLRPAGRTTVAPPDHRPCRAGRGPAHDLSMSSKSAGAGPSGALYGLGILGAWVYFWQQADGFRWYLWAVLEGLVWPAFMVFWGLGALD